MSICKLCLTKEADKTNTHYLTDYIIRSCLNQDGVDGDKNRDRGAYFDMSSGSFPEFKYQRNTSPGKIEEVLGREATEDEIETMKRERDFSVDNFFCSECEARFGEIETDFREIYVRFRRGEFGPPEVFFDKDEDILVIRLFFLLQVWRTAVCDISFILSNDAIEGLRKQILKPDLLTLKKYPLAITYLKTEGENIEYTSNRVGPSANMQHHAAIVMNDFVIQFYEKVSDFKYDDLYGINQSETFVKYINIYECSFVIRIASNEERKQINTNMNSESAERQMAFWIEGIKTMWKLYYQEDITEENKVKFVKCMTERTGLNQYSKEEMKQKIIRFLREAKDIC